MFDMSRLGDTHSGFTGQALSGQSLQGVNAMSVLSQAGIAPSQLQGLDMDQITELLSQHGIDLSQLDLSSVDALAGNAPRGILGALQESMGLRDL
jgi:hypothetical protein